MYKWSKIDKIVELVKYFENSKKSSKVVKILKIVEIVKNCPKNVNNCQSWQDCQNVGQVMSPHHSDQMSQRSQVSRVPLCMSKVKVPWVSEWVTQWQGHLMSCSGQLQGDHVQLSFFKYFVNGQKFIKVRNPIKKMLVRCRHFDNWDSNQKQCIFQHIT